MSHIERVKAEQSELWSKLDKLDEFIDLNPLFKGLPIAERDLLRAQRGAMQTYSTILTARLRLANGMTE